MTFAVLIKNSFTGIMIDGLVLIPLGFSDESFNGGLWACATRWYPEISIAPRLYWVHIILGHFIRCLYRACLAVIKTYARKQSWAMLRIDRPFHFGIYGRWYHCLSGILQRGGWKTEISSPALLKRRFSEFNGIFRMRITMGLIRKCLSGAASLWRNVSTCKIPMSIRPIEAIGINFLTRHRLSDANSS